MTLDDGPRSDAAKAVGSKPKTRRKDEDLELLRAKVRDVLGDDSAEQEAVISQLTASELRSMLAELGLLEEGSKRPAKTKSKKRVKQADAEPTAAESKVEDTAPSQPEELPVLSPFMAAVLGKGKQAEAEDEPEVEVAKWSKVTETYREEELEPAPEIPSAVTDGQRSQEFLNICAWCGACRRLPFDLRSDFVCQDAGLTCNNDALRAAESLAAAADVGESTVAELFSNECAWCGEIRHLPFALGEEFICRDVGLECTENSAARKGSFFCNACAFCGSERELPHDFGQEFICEFAGFDCDYSTEEAKGRAAEMLEEITEALGGETFVNVCADCGAERELPFDLRASFVCGDAGLQCGRQELFPNVCVSCSQTRMCPFTVSDGFVCGGCSSNLTPDGRRFEESSRPEAPTEEFDDGLDDETREAIRRDNERTQLLWKVLIQGLSVEAARDVFTEKGHEPPTEQELMDLRTNTLAHFRKKTIGSRMMAKAALKTRNKKGSDKRWLNNELVTVTKNDKYVREAKESLEDKAKTSVELYILGIGRGGRHAVKIARDEKKKGPISNKYNK